MVYYKLTLNDKRPTKDEVYSVVVRITSNKQNTTFTTGVRIEKKFWDDKQRSIKSSKPNSLDLNNKITGFYLRLQKMVLKLEDEQRFNFNSLRELVTKNDSPCKPTDAQRFDQFAAKVIGELHELNKSGNALIYQTAWNRFHNSIDNKPITFKEVDYTLLESFKKILILDGVKPNTISNYFRTLRAIYNRGIKAKLVDKSFYPFLDVSAKPERTTKRAIKINDIAKLQTLDIKLNATSWNSRNYFMLSLSLIGISFTDLAYLKPSNIINNRLVYKRRKTHKEYNIKLTPIAKSILDLYKGRNSKYLLPVLPATTAEDSLAAHKLIKQFIKTTNKYLRRMATEVGIGDITTYVARHSWATTAKRLGYSNELIAEALGHEYGNKITNIYLDNFEQSVIDEVNAKVLESLAL